MTSDLRPYPEYKDPGLPWLGRVPAHWDVRRLRTILKQRNEKNNPVQTSQILSLSIAHGVTLYSHEGRGGNRAKSDLSAYKIARVGDLVLNSMNVVVGAVGLSRYTGAISPVYYALYPRSEDADIRYYDKLFSNTVFQRYLLIFGKGILIKEGVSGKLNTIRMKISPDDLKGIFLPVPSPDEQKAIADYLDANAIKVRRFIRNRRRLIEVLNEQKQAIINRAVTRGLDPNAPLKPSGIDWLGDVPKHWEVTRIKHLFRESDARSGDGSGLLLSLTRRRGLVPHHEVSERPPSASDLSKYKVCKPGELVMNRMQAWSGMFAAVTQEGIISPDYCVFIPKRRMDVRYFELLFKTRLYVDQFIVFSKGIGSGFNRLYTPDFGAIAVAVPPEEEQARLLVKIDDDCTELNTLIARTEREIDLIREYRTRLITDVVTGKVDVRGLAPAEAPLDDEQIDEGIEDEEMLGDDEPELVEEAADADD